MRSRGRTFIATDNIGKPCDCLECQAAGVIDKPIRYVPADAHVPKAHWAHGEELKRWYAAYDQARADMRKFLDEKDLDPSKVKGALQQGNR